MKTDLPDGVYEFEDCFEVNPITHLPLTIMKPFHVVNGEMWPNPISEGMYKNCSKAPEGEAIDVSEEFAAAVMIGHAEKIGDQKLYEEWGAKWNALRAARKKSGK